MIGSSYSLSLFDLCNNIIIIITCGVPFSEALSFPQHGLDSAPGRVATQRLAGKQLLPALQKLG